jgi:hypothetical protein
VPRFPEGRVPEVTQRIRERFERWGVGPTTLVVCGGARGVDLIAAEVGLERGSGLRVVLALPEAEFIEASVVSPGTDWEDRFRRVISSSEIVSLCGDAGDCDENAFEVANERMLAEALAAAPRVRALVVWDGAGVADPGGTASFVESARNAGVEVEILRLVA